jgi:hypothetical protein
VAALGTPAEQHTWARLKRIENFLNAHPDDSDLAEMREQHRLLKGVMYWRLSESFKARLWNERRAVKELAASIKDTQKQSVLVRQARATVPSTSGGFSERIAGIRGRIDALQLRLAETSDKQNRYLQVLAIRELEAQRARIETYQIQARYELAAIYDRTQNPPAAEKPKP